MKRCNPRWAVKSRVFAVSVGLLLPVVCALAAGRVRSADVQPRSAAELAQERLVLAHRVLGEARNHKPPRDVEMVTLWFRRIAQTRREFGGRPDETIADLKAYADHTRVLEARAEHNAKLGLITAYAWDEARYQRLEAESWLAQASENLKK